MSDRSALATVRNPLLALPAMRRLQELPPEIRLRLRDLLREIAGNAAYRAESSWRHHKAPMAAYWRAVSMYANHTRKALR